MQIPSHILTLVRLGHLQQITEYLSDRGDKNLKFDGKKYVVSGFQNDSYFEHEFSSLEPAMDCYQAIKV